MSDITTDQAQAKAANERKSSGSGMARGAKIGLVVGLVLGLITGSGEALLAGALIGTVCGAVAGAVAGSSVKVVKEQEDKPVRVPAVIQEKAQAKAKEAEGVAAKVKKDEPTKKVRGAVKAMKPVAEKVAEVGRVA